MRNSREIRLKGVKRQIILGLIYFGFWIPLFLTRPQPSQPDYLSRREANLNSVAVLMITYFIAAFVISKYHDKATK